MLSIITPCSRTENLSILKDSIKFDKINKWYIVYDTSKISFKKIYDHPQIIELGIEESCYGAPQRNHGIDQISDNELIYMLDDDNIIHDEFWNLVSLFDLDHIYTFDQERCKLPKNTILKGDNPKLYRIDTAQFVIPKNILGSIRWRISRCADGYLMEELYSKYKNKFVYINKIACYWNKLNPI
jgi:hypothetical protein